MPFGDETNVRDLIEQRLKEATEELGRLDPNDTAKRKAKVDEITALTDNLNGLDQAAETRNNNNKKNDNDEDRLKIDNERLKLEKRKLVFNIVLGVLTPLTSFGLYTWSYLVGENMQGDKPMQRAADKIHDGLSKLTFK